MPEKTLTCLLFYVRHISILFSSSFPAANMSSKYNQWMLSCVDVGAEIGEEYGDVRPLTTNLQKVLRTNFAQLVKLINSSTSGLVSQLSRVGVISGQLQHHS